MSKLRRTTLLCTALALTVTPFTATSAATRVAAGPERSVYVNGLVSRDVMTFRVRADGGLVTPPRTVNADGGTRGTVLSADGRTAYVAVGFDPNKGDDARVIRTYRIGADGGLTPYGPVVATGTEPVSLALTPGGGTLYVSNRVDNTISAFTVAPDGALSPFGEPVASGEVQPNGLAVTPDGHFLYVSHRGKDAGDFDAVTTFAIGAGGELSPRHASTPIGRSGGAMAVTPDGKYLYVPCSDSGDLFAFAIGAGGELSEVAGSPFDPPDLPISAVATPDGRHLYVADGGLLLSGSKSITTYDIGAGGVLRHRGEVDAHKSPVAMALSPSGRRLYVSNIDSDDVSGFAVDPGGALTALPGSPYDMGKGDEQAALQAVAVSPDQGPVASLTSRVEGLRVSFSAAASSDPDGRVVRYDWDFGDGVKLPDGGAAPVHTYAVPGRYAVTVTVVDDEGCSVATVYTGQSVSCNGSPKARATLPVTVR
ncbi:beta-propeller fold lactonase family protein [Nonomuraea sp. PA05]|uniref:beta-propeller fold lactonase family protein n=1 Tax=Nonomuraea sp. PA05 TaxID=2604466 RepID=UPI0011D6A55E|nr:beta-propeller fold lactonase family protein [Nonomuraea sp. PA05]TYB64751.1 beta-propeller fold lactonase family protein [Nonomuraea sp. PA05]